MGNSEQERFGGGDRNVEGFIDRNVAERICDNIEQDIDDREHTEVTPLPAELQARTYNLGRGFGAALAIMAIAGGAFWLAGKRSGPSPQQLVPVGAVAPAAGADESEVSPTELAPDEKRRNTRDTVVYAALPGSPEFDRPKLTRMSVSFFLPPEGTVVQPTMLVRGMAKGIPEGKQLWLVTRRDPAHGVWPKEEVTLRSDGMFEREIWDFGADGSVSVCLLVTDDAETSRYDDWLLAGDRDDEWPALKPDPEHSTILGCQTVTLIKPKYH